MTDVAAARPGPARVRRWDPLVRGLHWSLVLLVTLNLALLDDESLAHEVAGYGVAAIVALRVLWGLVGPRRARFASFPPSIGAAAAHLRDALAWRRDTPHPSHSPLGALMVYNLLGTLAAISATGILMTTDAFWGVEWVEEAHEALADWLLVSIALHVGGVLAESARFGTSLVRTMGIGWARDDARDEDGR